VFNLNPDTQDLYLEQFDNNEPPTQYRFENAWHPLEMISETIEIKGGHVLHRHHLGLVEMW
jgi:acyl-homoserine lactone acylase PvdQ